MKKSTLLFSSIAVSLLLILISCTKENVIGTNPYRYQATANFADTPYLGSINPAGDTPYLKTTPNFVDTPYLVNNSLPGDTPYIKTEPPVDTPYLQNNYTLKSR